MLFTQKCAKMLTSKFCWMCSSSKSRRAPPLRTPALFMRMSTSPTSLRIFCATALMSDDFLTSQGYAKALPPCSLMLVARDSLFSYQKRCVGKTKSADSKCNFTYFLNRKFSAVHFFYLWHHFDGQKSSIYHVFVYYMPFWRMLSPNHFKKNN